MNEREQILDEINQICGQYRSEVPGKRKSWPKAVRERVQALHEMGLSYKAISDQTGVPYFTVLGWRSKEVAGSFKQLAPATVTVPVSQATQKKLDPPPPATADLKTATVTVTTPQGYRIDGLSMDQLLLILGKLP